MSDSQIGPRLRRPLPGVLLGILCVFLLSASSDQLLAATVTSKNLGTVAVGSSTSATLTFTFGASATVGSIKVVTQGATVDANNKPLDFQRSTANPGTCAAGTTYGAGQTCTVNVMFTPKGIGQRLGAVLLYDDAPTPNLIATAFLSGTGNGGVPSFSTTPTKIGTGLLFLPFGVAVDAAENVYVTERNDDCVVEVPANGGAQKTILCNLSYDNGVAVDGAGNIYVSAGGNDYLLEIPAGGGAPTKIGTGLGVPAGVAVDGAGNVYVSDAADNRVVKISADGGAQTVVGKGLNQPYGVAVDGVGNVFIADFGNDRVVKVPANGGDQTTVGSGLLTPSGVAVDGAGNVYVAEYYNHIAVEVLAGSGAQMTIGSGFSYPYSVALDGAGNIYIGDAVNSLDSGVTKLNRTQLPTSENLGSATVGAAPTTAELEFTNIGNVPLTFRASTSSSRFTEEDSCGGSVAVNSACTLDLTFTPNFGMPSPGTATSGTLRLSDNSLSPTQTIGLTGMAIEYQAAEPVLSLPAGTYNGEQMVSITDTTPGATIYYTTDGTLPGRSSPIYSGPITVSSSETIKALAIATNYLTSAERAVAYTIKAATNTVTTTSKNLGAVAVKASVTASVTLGFNASVTLGSIKVVTQGVTGLDFQRSTASPGTCSTGTAYAAGTTCTVNVAFTPQGIGQRMGAVLLYDNASSPNLIGTAFLTGTGDGGVVGFTLFDTSGSSFHPGYTTIGSPFNTPRGLAADGAGNIYIAYQNDNHVLEVPANGGASITIGSGLLEPCGVAVDGAGNVFIADTGNSRVVEVPATGGTQKTIGSDLAQPLGVAVDGTGNVYIADTGSRRVVEVPIDGSGQKTINTGPIWPLAVAVDGAGSVYSADNNTGQLVKTSAGGAPKTLGQIYGGAPLGLAVDGAGNIFLATGLGLMEMPFGSGGATIVSSYQPELWGVAVDGFGAIYTSSGPYGGVFKFDRTYLPATVDFGAATVGGTPAAAQVGFSNIGNAPLTFQTRTSSSQFTATNTCGGSVGVNSPCTINLTFSPTFGMPSPGTVTSGTLTMTDNSPSQKQAIGLTGIAIGLTAAKPLISPGTGTYTGAQMVSITDATPNATIYYTTDGTTPGRSSPIYSGPITVSSSETIKALAVAPNYLTSPEGVAIYTIKP